MVGRGEDPVGRERGLREAFDRVDRERRDPRGPRRLTSITLPGARSASFWKTAGRSAVSTWPTMTAVPALARGRAEAVPAGPSGVSSDGRRRCCRRRPCRPRPPGPARPGRRCSPGSGSTGAAPCRASSAPGRSSTALAARVPVPARGRRQRARSGRGSPPVARPSAARTTVVSGLGTGRPAPRIRGPCPIATRRGRASGPAAGGSWPSPAAGASAYPPSSAAPSSVTAATVNQPAGPARKGVPVPACFARKPPPVFGP